ncbi:hypothetical protein F8388_004776 [Cannabis sativa]|uniref:J domain-containing protein n=1 Tax=Cannabis sativa TaxID=3483 RepID=A0A7J6HQ01_CANSA|nr:hypothetical protein F8388_004776 [Cannabis sativa]
MEWNREEGIKAKEIAEKKLIANDIMGAKKFALKAQTLYPNLEGISKLILTIEVYICAENKINGVVTDWYGILGVDPKADDDTIRKQYRKLALMLHPDKNNSIGADDAFKLILEAWNLLSNKEQRDAYDKERNKAKMSSHDDQNVHIEIVGHIKAKSSILFSANMDQSRKKSLLDLLKVQQMSGEE